MMRSMHAQDVIRAYSPTTLTWVFSFPILMCFFKSQKVSKKEKRDEQKKNGEPSTHQGRGSLQRWMYAHHTSWLRRPVRGWKVDICAHCQRHSLRGQRVKIQRGGWWWKERKRARKKLMKGSGLSLYLSNVLFSSMEQKFSDSAFGTKSA